MTAPHGRDEPHDRDDDAVFRQIVAAFGEESTDVVPRWPVSEDLDGPAASATPTQEVLRPAPPEEALPGWLEPEALPDDGHFEPPPGPRLPRLRLRTLTALVVLLAGLAVLFFPFQLGLDDSGGSLVIGMVLVAGGGTLLVLAMRDAPGADDRPDDGAVV